MKICTCTYILTCVHACVHGRVYARARTYVRARVRVCIYIDMHFFFFIFSNILRQKILRVQFLSDLKKIDVKIFRRATIKREKYIKNNSKRFDQIFWVNFGVKNNQKTLIWKKRGKMPPFFFRKYKMCTLFWYQDYLNRMKNKASVI